MKFGAWLQFVRRREGGPAPVKIQIDFSHAGVYKVETQTGSYKDGSRIPRKGHLDLLKYAHENGCPWNELLWNVTKESNCVDIIQYLKDEGCPQPREW